MRSVMRAASAVAAGMLTACGADPATSPMLDASVDGGSGIDGQWLLAVNPTVAPGYYFQFQVTWDVTTGVSSGSLDGTYQPLRTFGVPPDSAARTPVGSAFVANAIPVTGAATFDARLVGTLPGDANAVSGTAYPLDFTLQGRIISDASVCGTVIGTLGPLSLDGSSFGAVRAPSGLPVPVAACP